MDSEAKKKAKDEKPSKPKKGSKEKVTDDKEAANDDQYPEVEAKLPNKTFKNPLPLITGKEAITPLAEGEHKFVSIVNGPPVRITLNVTASKHVVKALGYEDNLSGQHQPDRPDSDLQSTTEEQPQYQLSFTRVQQIENVLDDPQVPPTLVSFHDGYSYDCHVRTGLDLRPELCESCKEIWRRWPIRPPPPPEIDPFEDFLCVGDIDKDFQPARGDIGIFYPYGPQSLVGIRTGWGFISTYRGRAELKFHPNDLVLRLGSCPSGELNNNVVGYIPYEKVELRLMTKSMEWRFLGAQVSVVPKITAQMQPDDVKLPVADEKDAAGAQKKKDDGSAAKNKGKELPGTKSDKSDKPSDKENSNKKGKPHDYVPSKENKTGKKSATSKSSDAKKEGQSGCLDLSEFDLNDLPHIFNTYPKLPDSYVSHAGEKLLKSRPASMTCNYRYHKPGMSCGRGEVRPQLGDIILREPNAWLHDDWGNRIKRPKGSMIKWYKPPPWKREFKPGMMLLRPYADKDSRLNVIPHYPCTPTIRSQWGNIELYVFEGPETAKPREELESCVKGETEVSGGNELAAIEAGAGAIAGSDGKQKKDGKDINKAMTKGKKADSSRKDDTEKTREGQNKKGQKGVKDSSGLKGKQDIQKGTSPKQQDDDGGKTAKTSGGDELNRDDRQKSWTYWGRCMHVFDRDFRMGTLDEICDERHQAETKRALDLQHQFFVEDSGAESDMEIQALLLENATVGAAVKPEEATKKKLQKGREGLEAAQTQTRGKMEKGSKQAKKS